jgi:hypothetical protein
MKYLILLLLVLGSCTKTLNSVELSVNQSTWESLKVVDYEFTLLIDCYCTQERVGPHLIRVIDGKITLVNDSTYDISKTGPLMTIDELFVFIKTSLERNPFNKSIEYNPSFGYPQKVYFDFVKEMADEEIGYRITSFKEI